MFESFGSRPNFKIDALGNLVTGDKPSKEAFLHHSVYRVRDDSHSIVHLHSTHSVAVSVIADIDPTDVLPAITAYYVMRVGRLPLVPGTSLDAAVYATEELEETAKLYLMLRNLPIKVLTDDQRKELNRK